LPTVSYYMELRRLEGHRVCTRAAGRRPVCFLVKQALRMPIGGKSWARDCAGVTSDEKGSKQY